MSSNTDQRDGGEVMGWWEFYKAMNECDSTTTEEYLCADYAETRLQAEALTMRRSVARLSA